MPRDNPIGRKADRANGKRKDIEPKSPVHMRYKAGVLQVGYPYCEYDDDNVLIEQGIEWMDVPTVE